MKSKPAVHWHDARLKWLARVYAAFPSTLSVPPGVSG